MSAYNGDMRMALLFVWIGAFIQAQDLSRIAVEKVSSGFEFTEGPAWSHEGFILFSDVPADRIVRIDAKGKSLFRENSYGANGNAFDNRSRLYTCESRTRRVTRTDKNGKIEVIAEKWQGKRLNAPNDIVVTKSGHAYFTDPAFGPAQNQNRELDFYGVYHISNRGELNLVAQPKGRPNGIALSPDGNILYVTNSDERNVRAYDLQRNGSVANERILISGIDGPPDGMAVDEKGNLYVTAKHLAVYSSAGKLLDTITIPETPANCTFGDADLQTLYVTARTSLYRIRLDVKGALPY